MRMRWTQVMVLGIAIEIVGVGQLARAQSIPVPRTPPIVRAIQEGEIAGDGLPSPQSAAAGVSSASQAGVGGESTRGATAAPGQSPRTGSGGLAGAEAVAPGASGPDFGAAADTLGPGFGAAIEAAVATPFAMIGDMSPISFHAFSARTNAGLPPPIPTPGPPHPPGSRAGSPPNISVRAIKITENQSPRPMDRVYFDFNYYNNVNDTVNRRNLSPITRMQAYTYLFGLEKTFNGGLGSIGLRVPLENLSASSVGNVVSTPTTTATGDLSIFAKYILAQDKRTGSLVSVGFDVTLPTGPASFAGAPYLLGINSVYFQPFLGYIYNYNRWYFQGFTGMTYSASVGDASFVYNDFGVGYFLKRSVDPREFVTALAPSMEIHVNNPMNHRDPYNVFDLAGSADNVDLTFGLNVEIHRAAVITLGFVTPLASPKPFDTEALIMLNIYYGRSRGGQIPITPPPL